MSRFVGSMCHFQTQFTGWQLLLPKFLYRRCGLPTQCSMPKFLQCLCTKGDKKYGHKPITHLCEHVPIQRHCLTFDNPTN